MELSFVEVQPGCHFGSQLAGLHKTEKFNRRQC